MHVITEFVRNRDGGVAVIIALAATALLGVLGLAVDGTRAYTTHSALQGAADAAALAAVSHDAIDLGKGKRRRIAKQYFHANCDAVGCGDVSALKVRFRDSGNTVRVTAESELQSTFGAVLGVLGMRSDVEAVATVNASFTQVHLVLDTSESMNIADGDAEIDRLMELLPNPWMTGHRCAFACHNQDLDGQSYYEIAKANGVQLRIDRVRDSAIRLVDLIAEAADADHYSVGVTVFNDDVETIQAPDMDLDAVRETLGSSIGSADYTHLRAMLTDLPTVVGSQGDGSSAEQPRVLVVLVTDGVETLNETSWPSDPIDPQDCDAIKNDAGIELYLLNITHPDPGYLSPYEDRVEGVTEVLDG